MICCLFICNNTWAALCRHRFADRLTRTFVAGHTSNRACLSLFLFMGALGVPKVPNESQTKGTKKPKENTHQLSHRCVSSFGFPTGVCLPLFSFGSWDTLGNMPAPFCSENGKLGITEITFDSLLTERDQSGAVKTQVPLSELWLQPRFTI